MVGATKDPHRSRGGLRLVLVSRRSQIKLRAVHRIKATDLTANPLERHRALGVTLALPVRGRSARSAEKGPGLLRGHETRAHTGRYPRSTGVADLLNRFAHKKAQVPVGRGRGPGPARLLQTGGYFDGSSMRAFG